MSINEIKKLGLSTNKSKTIKELSELFLDKRLCDLHKLDEENLHQKLLSVFGIGPWSVNMFEIFCLEAKYFFIKRCRLKTSNE